MSLITRAIVELIAQQYRQHLLGKRTVVVCSTPDIARAVAAEIGGFTQAPRMTAGATYRRELFEWFSSDRNRVLCGTHAMMSAFPAGVLAEGVIWAADRGVPRAPLENTLRTVDHPDGVLLDLTDELPGVVMSSLRETPFRGRLMVAAEDGLTRPAGMRELWRAAGGKFHGPNVETGYMPEAQLLPFLQRLVDASTRPEWERFDPVVHRVRCENAGPHARFWIMIRPGGLHLAGPHCVSYDPTGMVFRASPFYHPFEVVTHIVQAADPGVPA